MLYTVIAINGNEVILDKQPPSTAFGNHNGLIVDAVPSTLHNTIIISEQMQEIFALEVGSQIELFHTNPGFREKLMYPLTKEYHDKALRYNEGKLRWSLVDFKSLEPMVQVLEFGAKKYEEDNWKKPMDKKQILNSMMRHVVKLMDGEEVDSESGLGHIGHVMANALFYSYHSKSNDSK